MKFRKRGKLEQHNNFTREQDKLENVAWFNYLRIKLKTS
jgi:hypothetical protein